MAIRAPENARPNRDGPRIALNAGPMLEREPDIARVLAQVEESLRAIKGHIVNYRLQLLMMRVGKKVETWAPGDADKSPTARLRSR